MTNSNYCERMVYHILRYNYLLIPVIIVLQLKILPVHSHDSQTHENQRKPTPVERFNELIYYMLLTIKLEKDFEEKHKFSIPSDYHEAFKYLKENTKYSKRHCLMGHTLLIPVENSVKYKKVHIHAYPIVRSGKKISISYPDENLSVRAWIDTMNNTFELKPDSNADDICSRSLCGGTSNIGEIVYDWDFHKRVNSILHTTMAQ